MIFLSKKNNQFTRHSRKNTCCNFQLDINNFPNLVHSYDETGLSFIPSVSSKIIALKGSRQVQKLPVVERGTLTTYLVTIYAEGDNLPPFFIFNEKKVLDVSKYPLVIKYPAVY